MKTKYIIKAYLVIAIVIISLSLINQTGNAQISMTSPALVHLDGDAHCTDGAKDVAVDTDGNIYVTGTSYTTANSNDITTVKYDKNMVEKWKHNFHILPGLYSDAGKKLVLWDSVYTGGHKVFVFVTGTVRVTPTNQDIVLIKYDGVSGAVMWFDTFGGTTPNGADEPRAIAINDGVDIHLNAAEDFGNVSITGSCENAGTGKDIVTIKYYHNGGPTGTGGPAARMWLSTFDCAGLADAGADIIVNSHSDVCITGYATRNSSANGLDYCTIIYVWNTGAIHPGSCGVGIPAWPQYYNGTGNSLDSASAIAVDRQGKNLYVTGSSIGINGTYDYATIAYDFYSPCNPEIVRYDNPVAHGHDYATGITIHKSTSTWVTDVYVTGNSYNGAATKVDVVTEKYRDNGPMARICTNTYTAGTDDDRANEIIYSNGYVYVAGASKNAATYYDYLLLKYNFTDDNNCYVECSGLYDDQNHTYDESFGIAATNDNNIIMTGTGTKNSSLVCSLTDAMENNLNGPSTIHPNQDYLTLKFNTSCKVVRVNLSFSTQAAYIDTFRVFVSGITGHGSDTIIVFPFGGLCTFDLPVPDNDTAVYLVIKNRNSIETWSANPINVSGDTVSYDFTISASQAYGNNLKLENGKWVIFKGDINQNGFIDLSDILLVANDMYNFTTGYVNTDVNNDNLVDLSDLLIVFNNSAGFIHVIKP